MINITETYTTMLGAVKDFEAMTKEDFHYLLKAKEKRIQKLKGRIKELAYLNELAEDLRRDLARKLREWENAERIKYFSNN